MLKKTITFDDLDGNQVSKDYYFHMSIDDLASWNETREGGMEQYLAECLAKEKTGELFDIFRGLIAFSVGVKSDDNLSFIKDESIKKRFVSSDAYSSLVMELITDPSGGKAIEFFNGVMPKKLREQVGVLSADKLEQSATPAKPKTLDDYTMAELTNMPYAEFEALIENKGPHNVPNAVLMLAFQRRSAGK